MSELELQAEDRAVEKYRTYVSGTEFDVEFYHKTLTSIIIGNRANKTISSRLTRWVERLLPFQFTGKHNPRRTLGVADY